ncbi:MAG: phytanoyl-CoA dioxygenase family protein [Ramlibacter sp.]
MSVLATIVQQPALAYYYAQKAVRSVPLRRGLAKLVVGCAGRQPARPAPHPRGDHAAAQLRRDGLSLLPDDIFPAPAVAAVRAHLRGRPAVDQYDGVSTYDVDGPLPAHCTRLYYRGEDLLGCRELVDLANHPLVLDAVGEVLGTRPTIGLFLAWWTLGENFSGQLQYDDAYHRDVDDFRFVKLFVYLTDTDEHNGAHSFVRGSHRSELFTRRGIISDEQVRAHFPAQDIVTVKGPAGTAFLEDTWGIHRPLLATQGRRLIFSVLYGLTPWVAHGPGRPTLALPPGLDPFVNRALFKV